MSVKTNARTNGRNLKCNDLQNYTFILGGGETIILNTLSKVHFSLLKEFTINEGT